MNLFGLGSFLHSRVNWLHVHAKSTGVDDGPEMILLICSGAVPRGFIYLFGLGPEMDSQSVRLGLAEWPNRVIVL